MKWVRWVRCVADREVIVSVSYPINAKDMSDVITNIFRIFSKNYFVYTTINEKKMQMKTKHLKICALSCKINYRNVVKILCSGVKKKLLQYNGYFLLAFEHRYNTKIIQWMTNQDFGSLIWYLCRSKIFFFFQSLPLQNSTFSKVTRRQDDLVTSCCATYNENIIINLVIATTSCDPHRVGLPLSSMVVLISPTTLRTSTKLVSHSWFNNIGDSIDKAQQKSVYWTKIT